MIAVSMGDPCGIGPEVTLKALANPAYAAHVIVVGDAARLAREAQRLHLPMPPQIESVLSLPNDLAHGQIDARAGAASFSYVERAIALAMAGTVQAVVTAPIAKAAWHAAGHREFPGHTELLAARSGGVPVRMMLANNELRVVLVSIHLPLRDALAALSIQRIVQTIELTEAALQRAGLTQPRIAVAGVNPHAGEGGLFGREEIEIIEPAVRRAQALGINVAGPIAPDTVFMRARGFREFDAVIAMYHDQGLIPVKYLGLDDGVNITIGLPFVRTSPDHGTAFDIAGKSGPNGHGLADARSMSAAIEQALGRPDTKWQFQGRC
jgi:4-hydroxythreonine-4-phosphate dehydrogenase